jgi:hypothetical protein
MNRFGLGKRYVDPQMDNKWAVQCVIHCQLKCRKLYTWTILTGSTLAKETLTHNKKNHQRRMMKQLERNTGENLLIIMLNSLLKYRNVCHWWTDSDLANEPQTHNRNFQWAAHRCDFSKFNTLFIWTYIYIWNLAWTAAEYLLGKDRDVWTIKNNISSWAVSNIFTFFD